MDPIKEAFAKIKQDIVSLQNEIISLKTQISDLKQSINFNPTDKPSDLDNFNQQTNIPTNNPTENQALEPLKPQNLPFSTRNKGVPTDKPTNQQTNQQTDKIPEKFAQYSNIAQKSTVDDFQNAAEILNSLDNVKKNIRLKFKKLTPQEMTVFSALYSLDEQNYDEITYKILAQQLNLSESSIRDYINRLISKGIPILKTRMNNKKIILSVSDDLKQIANLSTIIKLRDL
ncbi:MAG: HTH domain-containing protein [Nanoarchaeota archaeon]